MTRFLIVLMVLSIGFFGMLVHAAAPLGHMDSKPALREVTATDAASYDRRTYIDANRILMMVYNDGNIAYDRYGEFGRTAGLYFPYSGFSGCPGDQTVVYAAGLWLAGKVNGEVRIAQAEYSSQFRPGPMANGTFSTDRSTYRVFKITQSSNSANPDYSEWPASDGAPVDQYGNPLRLGDQTLWTVYNDADSRMRLVEDMSTEPLGIEVQQTVWASDNTADETVLHVKYKLYNRGGNQIDSFYIGFWVDPDLGDAADDLVGCDSLNGILFCYNQGSDVYYPAGVPAWGGIVESGPVVPSVGDVAMFDGNTLYDYKNVGMSSFTRHTNGTDPQNPSEVFSCMKGLTREGLPYSDPTTADETKFPYSGDPVMGSGWLDEYGEDKRLMINFGPFSFAPGDSQQVILKICADLGTDELNSVTKLKGTLLYGSSYSLLPDVVTSGAVDMDIRDYGELLSPTFCPKQENWFYVTSYGSSWVYGSALSPDEDPEPFHRVEIRLSPTTTQKAYRYVIDDNYAYGYSGYYDVPFTVWDVEDDRQLNVAFVERLGRDNCDAAWTPPQWNEYDSFSEYLLVFNSNYSGANPDNNSIGYENLDLADDAAQFDVLYYVRGYIYPGHEISELSSGQRLLLNPQKTNQDLSNGRVELRADYNCGSASQYVYVNCQTSQMSLLRLTLSDSTSFSVSPDCMSFTSSNTYAPVWIFFDPPAGKADTVALYFKDMLSGITKAQLWLDGSGGSTYAPVISDIPDQILAPGESFQAIDLPTYVQDADNSEEELAYSVYSFCQNVELDMNASHVVTIQPKNSLQPRADILRFMVTDPDGWTDVDTVLLQTSSSSYDIAQTYGNQYRMISLPMVPENSSRGTVLDELTGDYGYDWKLLRWNPVTGAYESSPSSLEPGLAYWIVTAEPKQLSMSGAAAVPTSTMDFFFGTPYYSIPISAGWNQIGVPCSYSLDFSKSYLHRRDEYFYLQDALCHVRPVIYHYNGNGYEVQTCYDSLTDSPSQMESGDGYWIFVDEPCDYCELLLMAEEGTPQPTAAKQPRNETLGNWTISISAACAGYSDNYNQLGVRDFASDAKDRFDLPEPPTISSYVSLAFDGLYTTDYRPSATEGTTWHFSVRTNVDDVVELSFDYDSPSDNGLGFALTDLYSGQELIIHNGTTYRYESGVKTRDFEITVVDKDHQVSNNPQLPNDFQLHANYPNPFNGETVISFTVPRIVDATLTISNALGQQVRAIEMSHLARGTHEFTWDGTDADGKPVASGVYFYTLGASEFGAARKMVLLK